MKRTAIDKSGLSSWEDIGIFKQLHGSLELIAQDRRLVLANLRLVFDARRVLLELFHP